MSKQVPQPEYGLKGGTRNFDAHELGEKKDHHRHKMEEEHEQRVHESKQEKDGGEE